MKEYLAKYQYYEGDNQELHVYATELGFNKELTPALLERYDENMELLEEELEEQEESDNPMFENDTENELCDNEIL